MKHNWLISIAMMAAVWLAQPASAAELQPVAHPEELGFAPDRLQRITQVFQGMSMPANCRGRSS